MISTAYSSSSRRRRRSVLGRVGVGDLDRQAGPLEAAVADQRAGLGQRGEHLLGRGCSARRWMRSTISISIAGGALQLLVDVPAAVRGLAPRRPVERDVGDDTGRLALAGQAVARLPRDVAEQDVDLEVLLERLALEERGLERVPQRADGIGEDVVEHPAFEATRRIAGCRGSPGSYETAAWPWSSPTSPTASPRSR